MYLALNKEIKNYLKSRNARVKGWFLYDRPRSFLLHRSFANIETFEAIGSDRGFSYDLPDQLV